MAEFPEHDVQAELARQKTKFAVLTAIATSLAGAMAALLIALE
jgi:hypothetical protein